LGSQIFDIKQTLEKCQETNLKLVSCSSTESPIDIYFGRFAFALQIADKEILFDREFPLDAVLKYFVTANYQIHKIVNSFYSYIIFIQFYNFKFKNRLKVQILIQISTTNTNPYVFNFYKI